MSHGDGDGDGAKERLQKKGLSYPGWYLGSHNSHSTTYDNFLFFCGV